MLENVDLALPPTDSQTGESGPDDVDAGADYGQNNKNFKSKHSSKGSLKAAAKGELHDARRVCISSSIRQDRQLVDIDQGRQAARFGHQEGSAQCQCAKARAEAEERVRGCQVLQYEQRGRYVLSPASVPIEA